MSEPDRAETKDMIDLVHESILVRDPAGYITHWSQGSEELYGWPRNKAVGRKVEELLPTTLPLPTEEIEAVLARTGKWEGEIRRVTAQGRDLTIYARWAKRPASNGQPACIVESAYAVDAASQEEALRASEYRYRNLFQAMAASFWEIDFKPVGDMLRRLRTEGVTDFRQYFTDNPSFVREMMRASRIIDVNDETVALYAGGDRAKMNLPLDAFWPEGSTQVYAESVLAAISRQPNYSTETRLRKTNGEVFDALFTACFPLESVAKGTLLVGVIDISERKKAFAELERSEARYRNLFHSMGVTCYQLDIRGVLQIYAELKRAGVTDLAAYIRQNPNFVKQAMDATIVTDVNDPGIPFVGAKSREEVLGPVTRFWYGDDCEGYQQALIAGFNGEPRFETETRQRTLDGRRLDVIFTMVAPPAMRDSGIALVSLIDISGRVQARAALEKLQNEFAHAARISMLGELTASLAHEVNQPLAAISTNGSASLRWLARQDPDLEEVVGITRRMVADAGRAAEIISRIRQMASRREPEKQPLSINGLIEEAMLFLRHEMQAQGVSVSLQLDHALPIILGDRTQLQQVVVNLAMNAVQAMAQAAVPARALHVVSSQTEGMLRVDVEDNGPGIPDDARARLFESFYTTKPGGMGMGLPICRSIIEMHGGAIHADSAPWGGARFTFTLPLIPMC